MSVGRKVKENNKRLLVVVELQCAQVSTFSELNNYITCIKDKLCIILYAQFLECSVLELYI